MDTKYNIVCEPGLSDFVDKITTMQMDLDYLTQFVMNVTTLFRGKTPAILINPGTGEVAGLCNICWKACVEVSKKLEEFSDGTERVQDIPAE